MNYSAGNIEATEVGELALAAVVGPGIVSPRGATGTVRVFDHQGPGTTHVRRVVVGTCSAATLAITLELW